MTLSIIDNDKVRLLCIGAQMANIDVKIDAALMRVMKGYKDVLGSLTGLSPIPMASSTEKAAAAIAVCKHIIICFGLPTIIDFRTAYEILKMNVWDDMGNNAFMVFAEVIAVVGICGSVATGGMPFFFGAMAVNVPLVVPAIARMYFILACDLILVLIMCFKESMETMSGQPTSKDLARHAREYRWSGLSQEVHGRVKALIPRHNLAASYRTDKIRKGVQNIIRDYRKRIPMQPRRSLSLHHRTSSESQLDGDLSKDEEDLKAVLSKLA